MATTTYFGWETPDDTDLVKDGAAAIRTLGSAIDSSMSQLEGGTTGQILSKTSATDMAFTWINNDQGDITAVTAGTGISGGGTSGAVTVTNSMATAIDAKGDLIVGTGADAFSRLAVGATNGQVLMVDSAEATGLKYATVAAVLPTASARQSVTQSIANATTTKATFTSEDYDTNNNFASSTFTATIAGYYMVNAQVGINYASAANLYIFIYKNGANETNYYIDAQAYASAAINAPVYLAVNDTLEIYLNQSSGATRDTGAGNRTFYFAITGIRS